MGNTGRNKEKISIGRRENYRSNLSIGSLICPQIQKDIKDAARDAVNQFGVVLRWNLKMHPPNDSLARNGKKLFLRLKGNSKLLENLFVIGLHKLSPIITQRRRLQEKNSWQQFVINIHRVDQTGIW
jgi:hypothetical protein